MTLVNDNTQIVINHPQKGTHLTIQERGQIQAYKEIDSRSEIGHFEIDTVVGKKDSIDNVLMVLTDRLSRYTMIFRIKDKSSEPVNKKLEELKFSMGEKTFYQTFKSLTSDNGLEFSRLQ